MSETIIQGGMILEANPNELCADPLVDETAELEQEALLQRIDAFAEKGVTVRVLVLDSIADEGYDELQPYLLAKINECGWYEPDQLIVAVSLEPRKYEFYKDGRVEQMFSSVNNEDIIKNTLVEGLRDTETSYQQDVAKVLDVIDEQLTAFEAVEAEQPVPEVAQPPKEPSEPIDWHLREVGYGAGALTATAIIAGALGSRSRFNKARREVDRNIGGAQNTAVEALSSAREIVGIVPDADAPELRRLYKDLEREFGAFFTVRDSFERYLRARRGGLFRRPKAVGNAYQMTISASVARLNNMSNHLARGAEDLQNDILVIASEHGSFKAQIATLRSARQELLDAGFSDTYFSALLAEFEAEDVQVDEMRGKNFVQKPMDILQASRDRIGTVIEQVRAMPQLRDHVRERIATLRAREMGADITGSKSTYETLKGRYDRTCWVEIEAERSILDAAPKEIDVHKKRLTANFDSMDILTILDSQTTLEAADQAQEQLLLAMNRIKERFELVEGLRVSLPEAAEVLTADAVALREEVADYAIDELTGATRNAAVALQQKVLKFGRDVKGSKPKYLLLDEQRAKIEDEFAKIRQDAETEAEEYRRALAEYAELSRTLPANIRGAKAYIAGKEGKVSLTNRQAIEGLHYDDRQPAGRDDLFAMLVLMQTMQTNVSTAHAAAQSDVASHDYTPPSYSSGSDSSHDTGSFSGGSFDFGGGSSDSGGSFSGGDW